MTQIPPRKSGPSAGVKATAEMLNHMDAPNRERLLGSVAEKDPHLAEEIRLAMFTFSDVFKLEDIAIQTVLREVPVRKLAIALRGADPAILEVVFKHLSSRAGDNLREEIDTVGPQPLSEVEAKRGEIVELARRFKAE